MDGRHGDWAKVVAMSPVPQFLQRIVVAGFGGLLIDRFGYADNHFVDSVLEAVGVPICPGEDGRWLFVDLRAYGERVFGSLPPQERLRRREKELHPVSVEWRGAFSVAESN